MKKAYCVSCDKRTIQTRDVGEMTSDMKKPVHYTCHECKDEWDGEIDYDFWGKDSPFTVTKDKKCKRNRHDHEEQ
jgi:hypothetical protein